MGVRTATSRKAKKPMVARSEKTSMEKCRHMEDRQGYSKPDKGTKYKGKPLQEAYIHTRAEERKF